mgnify:FL=1|tara:strand:+ start:796 stop:1017 length:222 start_codon:yes stop_codon:yes gene_type:complete
MNRKIHIFEPSSIKTGAEVTISSNAGRKTFHLKRPLEQVEPTPMAIESFALDPDYYAELMKRVESLHSVNEKK